MNIESILAETISVQYTTGRCARVIIELPLNQPPSIDIIYESITVLPDGQEIHTPKPGMNKRLNSENIADSTLLNALLAVISETRSARAEMAAQIQVAPEV